MKLTKTATRIAQALEDFTIIDAHEHLGPEHLRTSIEVDVFTLFSHYTRVDLIAAGMKPHEYDRLMNPDEDLDRRWRSFKPYLEHIRHGSYARPAFIAARDLFGFDDINDQTYRPLSERISAANAPGLYNRILRDRCKIEKVLACTPYTDYDRSLFALVPGVNPFANVTSREVIEKQSADLGMTAATLDDYLEVFKAYVRQRKELGAVGLKSKTSPYCPPSRKKAQQLFDRITRDGKSDESLAPLAAYIRDCAYKLAVEEDLTVAVHTGMWGDFTKLAAVDFIPVIMAHPETRFDLFHAGMPSPRETGVIGKNFPNVSLNLCWCHIISQEMTCSTLQEWLDLVPTNKIIAFGADYHKPVEKAWGHLVMAREDVARVLADRVDASRMSFEEALRLARKLFYDNPKRIYGLD